MAQITEVDNWYSVMMAVTDGIGLSNAGQVAINRGDYNKAIRLYKDAIGIKRRAYGEDSFHVCISLSGLCDAYLKNGDISNAMKECERMLGIATRINNSEQQYIAREILRDIRDFQMSE